MDALTNYIQKGKKLTFLKMFFVFFLLMVLIVGVAGIRLNYELNAPDFKAFMTEIPTIEIGQGAVIKPENTLWEKKLSDEKFLFKIDTTQDETDNLPENGMVLTRRNLIFTLNELVFKLIIYYLIYFIMEFYSLIDR